MASICRSDRCLSTSHSKVRLSSGLCRAGSPQLARDLKINIPVQAGKGYSITVKKPEHCPQLPLGFGEARVATSTLSHTLRFAGTLELSGLDLRVNQPRVNAILSAANRYLQDLGPLETLETWAGLRPCAPDGLPIIGRTSTCSNVILATGHAMMGLSLGPITGKLLSQLACNATPEIDLAPLSPGRFNRRYS